jgi:hypothetical protein
MAYRSIGCFATWTLAPFTAMLLAIAVLPLVIPHWWDSKRNKLVISALVSTPAPAAIVPCGPDLLFHSLWDYFSFLRSWGAPS